jgi:hypothetical protein
MDGQALNFRIGGDEAGFRNALAKARAEAQAFIKQTNAGFGSATHSGREFVRAANDSAAGFHKMSGAAKLSTAQMMALTHATRGIGEQMAMGTSLTQAFTAQLSHLSFIASGPGGVTGALRGVGSMIIGVATKFPLVTAVLTLVGGGLLGMEHQINSTSKTTVSFGNVAKATFDVIKDAVWSGLKPAFDAIAPWATAAWNDVVTVVKTAGNAIIGTGVAAVAGILAAWNGFPGAIGDLAFQAADKFYAGLTLMIRQARVEINGFIGSINGALKNTGIQIPSITGGGLIGLNPDGTQKHIPNPFAGEASSAGLDKAIKNAFSTDYLGEFYDAVKKNAVALAEAGDAGDKAGKKIGAGAKKATDPWKGLREVTDKTAKKMQEAAQTMGQTWGGALKGLLDGSMKLKDALISVGQSILKYFNQVNIAKGGSGLFGGGLFGGIMQGLLGFAKGGVFDSSAGGGLTKFARGAAFSSSVLTQPTVFRFADGVGMAGEAGPEAIMPLRRGPDGRLGVAAANGNARAPANQNLHITFGMKLDKDGNIRPFVENVAVGVTQSAFSKYDKNLPNRLNQVNERGI